MTADSASTITLVSHAGERARRGFGPVEVPDLGDALRPIVTVGTGVYDRRVAIHDEVIYCGWPASWLLHDLEVDESTWRFSGNDPFDDGCSCPEMFVSDGWLYRRTYGDEMVFFVQDGRNGPFLVTRSRWWTPTDVTGRLEGRMQHGKRTFWTLDEVNRSARASKSISVEIHDPELVHLLSPLHHLDRQIDQTRQTSLKQARTAASLAAKVEALLTADDIDVLAGVVSSQRSRFRDLLGAPVHLVDLLGLRDVFLLPPLD